jgi:hypothetical protein
MMASRPVREEEWEDGPDDGTSDLFALSLYEFLR